MRSALSNLQRNQLRDEPNEKEHEPLQNQPLSLPKRRALHTRWQSLAGVALFVSVVGTTYAYGIFSALLRTYLDYSQEKLDLIASIGNNGLYLSLIAGLLIERLGFKRVVRLGGLLIFIGFFYIWLAVKQFVASNTTTISTFYFLSQLGVCFHVASAITVAVKLFPHTSHGGAIGLAKGYFGMSSAVLGDIAGGVFKDYPTSYLLFIAVFIPIIGQVGVHYANLLPPHLLDLNYEARRGMYRSLDPFFLHWGVLFLTLTLVGYCEYAYELNFFQEVVTFIMILIAVLALLVVPQMYGQTHIPVEDCIAEQAVVRWERDEEQQVSGGSRAQTEDVPQTGESTATTPRKLASDLWIAEDANKKTPPRLFSQFLKPSGQSDSAGGRAQLSTRINSENLHTVQHTTDDGGDDAGEVEESDDPAASLLGGKKADPQPSGARSATNYGTYRRSNSMDSSSISDLDNASQASYSLSPCFYGESLPLSESVRTWRIWCLFVQYLIACGSGLMVIYNVYAIAEAVDKEASSFFVTFIALMNGLGRVVAGGMSDVVVHNDVYPISKLQLLAVAIFLMGATQFLMSFGITELLFPCLLAVGFLFGSIVSLTAINVADIFGEKYIATNFGCVDAAPIFGSYIYATLLVSIFYDDNATVEVDVAYYGAESLSTCLGADCFRGAFITAAVSCAAASALCFYLDRRTPR